MEAYGTLTLQSRLMSFIKGVMALKIISVLLTLVVGMHLLKILNTWGVVTVLMPNGKRRLVVVLMTLGSAFCVLTGIKTYPTHRNICSIQHYPDSKY